MKTAVLIEGICLIVLSLLGIGEGLRLIIWKDPYTLYDPLGPGLYVVAVGMGLIILGVVHLSLNYRKGPDAGKVPVDRKMRTRMALTVATCAVYVILINILGYLLGTLLFFLIQFRVQGIRSWFSVVALSLILSALSYLLFVQYCSVVFPRGVLFG